MAKVARRKNGKAFTRLPHQVQQSQSWKNLNGNAAKLLDCLIFQHRGNNNGDLTAAYSIMQDKFGFRSEHTVHRAVGQLMEERLIFRTREGYFMNPGGRCALYALTWLPINDCPGKNLEVKPTKKPYRIDWE